jgi:hypothetical protein
MHRPRKSPHGQRTQQSSKICSVPPGAGHGNKSQMLTGLFTAPDGPFKKLGSSNGEITCKPGKVRVWLAGVQSRMRRAANSTFERKRENRLVGGLGTSIALHAIMLSAILAMFTLAPAEALDRANEVIRVVFLPDPGPGGVAEEARRRRRRSRWRFHNTRPRSRCRLQLLRSKRRRFRTLIAPIITNNSQVIQAMGISNLSLAPLAGGGGGDGIGTGRGRDAGTNSGRRTARDDHPKGWHRRRRQDRFESSMMAGHRTSGVLSELARLAAQWPASF